MYIVYSVSLLFLCYILGTTSRFVGIAYHIVQLCMYGSFILFQLPFIYFLYGVEAGVLYTDTYMYLRRMGLAGRFGNGVYIYVCCIYVLSLSCTRIIIFGGVDTLISCCWVMVVSSRCILFIQSHYCFDVIFWVRRPGLWESRTI